MNNSDLSEYIVDKIYENIGGKKRKNGNKINISCPKCHDGKSKKIRGWFYKKDNGSFYCFNCSYTSSGFYTLADIEGKSVEDVKIDYLKSKAKGNQENVAKSFINNAFGNLKSSVKDIDEEKDKIEKITEITLPNTCVDWKTNEIARTLVENRKIFQAPFVPKNWNLYYDTADNRLVIPWVNFGKTVYYQSRKVYKHQEPKYKFPANTIKPIFRVNFDPEFPVMFLLEGVFDSIFVKNSTCVGSINLTEEQKRDLEKFEINGVRIVWLFDNHWVDEASRKAILQMAMENSRRHFFIWERTHYKDVNEYVVGTGRNPFIDESYLMNHTYSSGKAIAAIKMASM